MDSLMPTFDDYTPAGSSRTYKYLNRLQPMSFAAVSKAIIDGVDAALTALDGAKLALATYVAKGDLVAASGASAPQRVAVGADGQLLTADSTATSGVAWKAAPDSGFHPFILIG
jgi:hypothetical protein